MNQPFVALALHQVDPDNSSMWIVIIAVVVILFFIVLVVGVGLAIFFVMRKRKKAQAVPAASAAAVLNDAGYSAGSPQAAPQIAPAFEPPPSPAVDLAEPEQETRWPAVPDVPLAPLIESEVTEFDPSRTVAIVREPTVAITYGTIKFVSGVLAGEEFAVEPEGAYIGREPSLSQIVVSDPRISKRHLWVGVRDGVVTVVDQESRNGTFINDPRSDRIHEAKLNSGDTVIMGESDVARFEYHA
ncbi:MAG TPA: FHA domain-containing protein [Pyrinomonadaceae bacterium]|nr:FHA domain-containing protein [Pyrinomonadaceae bacterium]